MGLMVVADQGRGCAIETGQTTLSLFPSLFVSFEQGCFVLEQTVYLHLATPAPLPELCSLAVIPLMGALP